MHRTDFSRAALHTGLVLVAFLLGAGGGDALADDRAETFPNGRRALSSSQADTIRAPKRMDVAVVSSVGGTLFPTAGGILLINRLRDVPTYRRDGTALWLGVGSIAAGLLVGPSVGHFYAQNHDQAWTGLAIRGGAVLSGTLALWHYPFQRIRATPDRASSSEDESTVRGILNWVMIGSVATLVFQTFYDLLSTPQSVYDYNAQPDVRASVAPHVPPTGNGAGLTVRVQF